MGSCPTARVTPARLFERTGVDYCGPFTIKLAPGRGHKTDKAYVAVFVCMATRAIHLELVSRLSSEKFLEAFRRFVGRRGHVKEMFSDNGKNFVGAKSLMEQILATLVEASKHPTMLQQRVEWSFITPAAPHQGGLWEAAVKSFKYHLVRVVGEQTLLFEECTTLLVDIEACLNSRPLARLTDDPDDLASLTPGTS